MKKILLLGMLVGSLVTFAQINVNTLNGVNFNQKSNSFNSTKIITIKVEPYDRENIEPLQEAARKFNIECEAQSNAVTSLLLQKNIISEKSIISKGCNNDYNVNYSLTNGEYKGNGFVKVLKY